MHTNIVQKLPTNTESNIMRCSTVPRFKYLPISAPVLSSRGPTQSALSASDDDVSSRSSWKAYSSGELSPKLGFDDSSSFRVATPLLKSFSTQVGSKFGESTFKLGPCLRRVKLGGSRTNLSCQHSVACYPFRQQAFFHPLLQELGGRTLDVWTWHLFFLEFSTVCKAKSIIVTYASILPSMGYGDGERSPSEKQQLVDF